MDTVHESGVLEAHSDLAVSTVSLGVLVVELELEQCKQEQESLATLDAIGQF